MTEYEEIDNNGMAPVETPDDRVLRQLAGAAFLNNPGFTLILPSGRTIKDQEVIVFTSLFGPEEHGLDEQQ